MKKRFIVLISDSTEEKNKDFISFIKEHDLGWWNWLGNSWLLIDYNGTLTPPVIRDKLKIIYGEEIYNFVIEIKQQYEWAGFGPREEDKDMFKWVHDHWDKA